MQKWQFPLTECILYFLILITFEGSHCGYIKDQIIFRLQNVETNCVRMLNGTGSAGCQSNQRGNIGVLTQIKRADDVQNATEKLPLGITGIIALIDVLSLNRELIDILRHNQAIRGVVLFDGKAIPKKFSEDAACPNYLYSFNRTEQRACHPWNVQGALHPDGLRFLDIDKPIRFVNNKTEIDLLINECAIPFNDEVREDGFRCVARMTMFMLGAGNTEICMRRQKSGDGFSGRTPMLCDPFTDHNVFSMLPPLSRSKHQEKLRADLFVLAARMDTFSTIYNSRAGDISVVSSILPLLSVAQAIGKNMNAFLERANSSSRQLLFAFFHGESMGYIGSSRWLWDVANTRFPRPPSDLSDDNIRQIGIDSLSFWFELQQIASGPELFLHTEEHAYLSNGTLIDKIINASGINRGHFSHDSLPPSSYHTVLRNSLHIPGMVLSSFGRDKYNYNFLNSFFDTQIRVGDIHFEEYLNRMTMAAKTALDAALTYVFNATNPDPGEKFKIDKEYLRNLADCFFKQPKWQCPLIMSVLNATKDAKIKSWLQENANDLFIGTSHTVSVIRKVVHALLVQSLGDKEPAINVASEKQCKDHNKKQDVYSFVWQNDPITNKGVCYRTSIYLGMAKSPAFEIDGYEMSSEKYSTWVESRWTQSSFEIYIKPDYHLELYALLTAILVLLISAPLNYGLKEQWFIDNSLPPASPHQL